MNKLHTLLLAAFIAVPALGAQRHESPRLTFTPSTFRSEDGRSIEIDTATLSVPANRASRSDRRVSLPIVRFRATKPAGGAPIIYLSGGSGSGIAASRGRRLDMFLALRELGDVITFDLRGAGRSTPRIDCTTGLSAVSTTLSYDALIGELSRQASACADSLRRAGVVLEGHNVREVVADIDDIRSALGAKTVRLVGISTGSQLALEYVRRHPRQVDAAVAAGVQAPDQNAHSSAQQDTVLLALAKKLRETSPTAPDLFALIRTAIDSAGSGTHVIPVPGSSAPIAIGPFDIQLLVAATLGDRRQMAMLPTLLGAAARGNFAPMAMMKSAAARTGINSAYEALMDCQSSAPASRTARLARETKSSLLGRATLDFPEACRAWGVAALDASYRAPVRSSVPVLLISGTLDGRTPVRNAEDALSGLSRGSHLVIDGASHGDDLFLSSSEIVPTIVRFLGGAKLPRRLRLTAQ